MAKKKKAPTVKKTKDFTLEAPQPIRKRLKAELKPLLVHYGKAAAAFSYGSWESGVKSLIDAVATIKGEDKPEQLAWRLIYSSLVRACDKLLEEAATSDLFLNAAETKPDPESIADKVLKQLEAKDVTLDSDFFEHPERLQLLSDFQPVFREWLIAFGVPEAKSKAIEGRLPSYFVFELRREWRERHTEYEIIPEKLITPIDGASRSQRSWLEYAAWLQRQVKEPMFDESFSLADIYVPLRGAYDRVRGKDKTERTCVDLAEHLKTWAISAKSGDAIRCLSGGPGSGKSSFCKIFAAEVAEDLMAEGITTVFIPLHNFRPEESLAAAVDHYLRETDRLSFNPLDPAFLKSGAVFLIFDGLDELSQQGHIGARVAADFVRALEAALNNHNKEDKARLRILLTGRELVIQANQAAFRGERLLDVLPFCPPTVANKASWRSLVRHMEMIVEERQRREKNVTEGWDVPTALDEWAKLAGPTRMDPDQFDFFVSEVSQQLLGDENDNRARKWRDIFHELFTEAVLQGTPMEKTGSSASFRELRCQADHAEESLLAAYHACVKRVGEAEPLKWPRERQGAFGDWLHRIRGQAVNYESIPLWRSGYSIRRNNYNAPVVLKALAGLSISQVLAVTQDLTGASLNGASLDGARLDGASLDGARLVEANLAEAKLRGASLAEARLAGASLAGASLAGANMPAARLDRARLDEANLEGARLDEASLIEASLVGVSLDEASLALARLDRAILERASLIRANLVRASLAGASLAGASLAEANLAEANLAEANLAEANLAEARLDGAILYRANLEGAYLDEASLARARLDGASLALASLALARLVGARLDEADLFGARLDGAILDRAILDRAILEGANLGGARLDGASLDRAKIRRSQLSEAQLKVIVGEPDWIPEEE